MTAAKPDEFTELSRWDLGDLLPDTTEATIESKISDLESRVKEIEDFRSELDQVRSGQRLLEIVQTYEALAEQTNALAAYGSLWFAEDTQSEAALTFRNRLQQTLTDLDNRILYWSLWWQTLDDERVEPLLAELRALAADEGQERLRDYHFYLEELRRLKPYTLDERSEQIINLKDADGISGVMTLYSMLTNGFEYHLDLEGEPAALTRDGLMAYAHSHDAEKRSAAYQELYRVYGDHARLLAQMYVNRVRDWHNENIGLRGYSSPIAVRNVANDIPDEAVAALLEVVREQAPLFQRYFRLKAKWLGMDRLRRYDIYAPLKQSEEEIDFGSAVTLVLDTFASFHSTLERSARRVFEQQHIDSKPRTGKKGGAFCASVLPRLTPWVLVNFTGKLRDVATLAHELGHAVHSMLAEEHSLLTLHPSLPLAETASVFAEMLITDRLLAEQSDPMARRELLATAVDDIYATVLRQAFFVLFEQEAHEAIMKGRSPEELHELYLANLRQQFGDSVEILPEFRFEWLSIPHIYSTPFYCYAYTFGQLLVLALYRRFQEEGEAFKPSYLKLLAYGGSERPERILREAGVDPRDPEFWRGGFRVVEDMIDQLEELGTA